MLENFRIAFGAVKRLRTRSARGFFFDFLPPLKAVRRIFSTPPEITTSRKKLFRRVPTPLFVFIFLQYFRPRSGLFSSLYSHTRYFTSVGSNRPRQALTLRASKRTRKKHTHTAGKREKNKEAKWETFVSANFISFHRPGTNLLDVSRELSTYARGNAKKEC